MSITKKMFSIQGVKVRKDADNPFFKSKYQTLDGIMDVLLPLLQDEKLLVTHHTENSEVVTSVIDIESDGLMKSCFPLPQLQDPQKIGSAITYAKRYNIGQLFNILTDEDDDANSISKELNEKPWYNDFEKHKDKMIDEISDGKATPDEIIKKLSAKYRISKQTKEQILSL